MGGGKVEEEGESTGGTSIFKLPVSSYTLFFVVRVFVGILIVAGDGGEMDGVGSSGSRGSE